ncbi:MULTISPECIES: DUF6311 domain-containing protein [unclassified Sphingomonas]|uniref:DUF6311 domain-containing protein n=1 Tax=unclassified Sphingomonas TaxID=196159 RepID=UPI000BDBF9EB|nr:MAG: hypothetical protein B7Y98_12130 [Sphingomonas sp. 32-62-10]
MFAPIARGLSLIALALLAFAAWVHVAILDPTNVGWLLRGQDIGQSALGLAAYLRVGAWPSTHQAMLGAPDGATLLFTDSNPLLGLLLRPFAAWLPPGIQLIGLWLLACLMLHVLFAWLLVRRTAPDFLSAWLGTALLTMLPTLFNRIGHVNLCAHWLILWALWIFIDPRRARSPLWWAAVLGVAALVHVYLLLMVAVIWGSAILAALAMREGAGWRQLAGHALVLVMIVGLMALNGGFGGPFESTGSYGAFPMAIDALVNPANPSYTALLPSTPETNGRGFEGFQYLGAGLLALVTAAIAILGVYRTPVIGQSTLRRLLWLGPGFVALTLLAMSTHITFQGQVIARIPLDQRMIDGLDPIRASGRLFWPIAYAMVFAAILVVHRLGTRRAALLLAAALALQVMDIAPMLAASRSVTEGAQDRTVYRRTPDSRWDALVAQAAQIDFHPTSHVQDLQLLQELSWRAMHACRSTNRTYVARESRRSRARLASESTMLAAGKVEPTHLYILSERAIVHPALQPRIRRLDGVAILPATRSGKPINGCR